jgi:diguanylate cyclase (GGDEF)-like protein
MLHRMQGCETQEELAEVVACFAPQVFPELAGKLFVFDAARNLLVEIGGWQDAAHSTAAFVPNECWGLRRGHAHISNGNGRDISCPHLTDLGTADSLCVPLVAQGDTVGLLHFEELSVDPDRDRLAPRVYLEIMAENVGLALANIRLRQTLRSLAVRDPLTGLYNRRFLDEALNREVDRARVAGRPLACVMIDIDHFKRFNDSFGHDAGDAVMQHVAQIIARHCGPADHACRYGGEEFAIVLEDCDLDRAIARAEAIRVATRDIAIAHHGRALGSVTASFGVASLALEESATTLLQRADAALLEAKRAGRDRVMAGGAGAGALAAG